MDTFYNSLAAIENSIATVETQLGDPHRRNLLIRQTYLNSNQQRVTEDTLLNPKPYITSAPLKLVGLLVGNSSGAISISQTDYLIEVSRSQPYSLFVREDTKRATVIIDPPISLIDPSQPAYANPITKTITGGIPGRILHILDSDPIIWQLIVRAEKDS